MEIAEIIDQLKAPFPAASINWYIASTTGDKSRGRAVPYIDARDGMDRLDAVLGPQNWYDSYSTGPNGGVLCTVYVRLNDEWIGKSDGADNTDNEAVKGGISDAFKRACVKWGIGRYLYSLPQYWVEVEPAGKSYRIKGNPPVLPPWALPKGQAKDQAPKDQTPQEPKPVASTQLSRDAFIKKVAGAFKMSKADATEMIKQALIAAGKKYDEIGSNEALDIVTIYINALAAVETE